MPLESPFQSKMLRSFVFIFFLVIAELASTLDEKIRKLDVNVPTLGVSFDDDVDGDNDSPGNGKSSDNGGCGEHHHPGWEDLIEDLPGAPPHSFKQYAGYVTVDEHHERRLFYWFFHGEVDHCSKPLTLWLNGGPGCSSIAGGALSELGPFFPSKDGDHLIYNKNSWIQESNIIFLESPAGVGFSYSECQDDYHTGDNKTAQDTHKFLMGWFEKFPHFKNRPFYVAGESYAGHYILDLASLLWSKREKDEGIVNFKGFLLGNPWTVTSSDFKGIADNWWARSLVSTRTYHEFLAECSPLKWVKEDCSDRCTQILRDIEKETGDINPYDIYVDVCTTGPSGEARTFLEKRGLEMSRKGLRASVNGTLRSEYDPCIDNEVELYLNKPWVQKAIHAAKLPYRWQGCSDIVHYSLKDFVESKFHIWEELLSTPLQISVFSGDVDSVCPTIGTRDWIAKLEDETHLKLTHKWHPWYHRKQVGGYFEEYNGGKFRFVTVRNAGHMVPYTQPGRALALFRSFIRNTLPPHCHESCDDSNCPNSDSVTKASAAKRKPAGVDTM